jgi:hypothetical protein
MVDGESHCDADVFQIAYTNIKVNLRVLVNNYMQRIWRWRAGSFIVH